MLANVDTFLVDSGIKFEEHPLSINKWRTKSGSETLFDEKCKQRYSTPNYDKNLLQNFLKT